jgi:hypothetical protein
MEFVLMSQVSLKKCSDQVMYQNVGQSESELPLDNLRGRSTGRRTFCFWRIIAGRIIRGYKIVREATTSMTSAVLTTDENTQLSYFLNKTPFLT